MAEKPNYEEELVELKELLRPLKGTTLDLYMLLLSNMKRTYDNYQDLDLSRARQAIAQNDKMNDIYNVHVATVLADERDHRRELLGDRNKRYAYDTAYLYEVRPLEALGLDMILREWVKDPATQESLANFVKKKSKEE